MGDIALSRTSGSAGAPGPTSSHPHGSRHATRPLQRQDGHRETRPDDTRPRPPPRAALTSTEAKRTPVGDETAPLKGDVRCTPETTCHPVIREVETQPANMVRVQLWDGGDDPQPGGHCSSGGLWLWSSACAWAPSPSSLGSLPAGAGHTLLLVPHRRGRRPGGRRRAQAAPRPPGPLFGGSWSTTGRRVLSPPLLGTAPGPAPGPAPLCSVPRLWARPPHTAHPAVPAQALPASVQGHLWARGGALQLSSGH